MKNLISMIAVLTVVGSLLNSCSKEIETTAPSAQMNLKAGNAEFSWNDPVYAGEPSQFCLFFSSSKTNLQVQIYDPITGDWFQIFQASNASVSPQCFNYTFPSAGNYQLRYKIGSGGFTETTVTVTVRNLCVTAFNGAAASCGTQREANYTFTHDGAIPNVKIQGGLTNFTGGDAEVRINGTLVTFVDGVGTVGNYSVEQVIQGGSSNRRITVEGPASCTALNINIKWNSTNSGGTITGDWSASMPNETYSVPGLQCN